MIKNDVIYIKYEKDIYFKIHDDYLSITSNFLEGYTLIICIKYRDNQLTTIINLIIDNTNLTNIYEHGVIAWIYKQFNVIKKIRDRSYITVSKLIKYTIVIGYYRIS